MSAWRREAIRALPEHRKMIEDARSPMALWIDLWGPFVAAVRQDNESMIQRTMGLARYCLVAPDADVNSAVAVAFIEDLPTEKVVLEALPRLMTAQEVRDLRQILAYHIGDAAVLDLEKACVAYRMKPRRS